MTTLTDDLMKSFQIRSSFSQFCPIPNFKKRVSSLKFSSDGELLISANNMNTIEVYNCDTGKQETIQSQKHGYGFVEFLDKDNNILVTSTKRSRAIRQLYLKEYKYGTCFLGHTSYVTGLSVNVKDKLFLSGSEDRSVLLWDLRVPNPIGRETELPDKPLVSWHPGGNLFAVGLESNAIQLFDVRGVGYGPFNKFDINPDGSKWNTLKFSTDGDLLLISTCSQKIRVHDSTHGRSLCVFGSRKNPDNIRIDASFSPSSDYVLTGSADGNLHIYRMSSKQVRESNNIAELSSNRSDPITEAELNPKYAMIATAGQFTGLWLPKL